jgi:hypothetical protein
MSGERPYCSHGREEPLNPALPQTISEPTTVDASSLRSSVPRAVEAYHNNHGRFATAPPAIVPRVEMIAKHGLKHAAALVAIARGEGIVFLFLSRCGSPTFGFMDSMRSTPVLFSQHPSCMHMSFSTSDTPPRSITTAPCPTQPQPCMHGKHHIIAASGSALGAYSRKKKSICLWSNTTGMLIHHFVLESSMMPKNRPGGLMAMCDADGNVRSTFVVLSYPSYTELWMLSMNDTDSGQHVLTSTFGTATMLHAYPPLRRGTFPGSKTPVTAIAIVVLFLDRLALLVGHDDGSLSMYLKAANHSWNRVLDVSARVGGVTSPISCFVGDTMTNRFLSGHMNGGVVSWTVVFSHKTPPTTVARCLKNDETIDESDGGAPDEVCENRVKSICVLAQRTFVEAEHSGACLYPRGDMRECDEEVISNQPISVAACGVSRVLVCDPSPDGSHSVLRVFEAS